MIPRSSASGSAAVRLGEPALPHEPTSPLAFRANDTGGDVPAHIRSDLRRGLAFVGETCHNEGGGELPELLLRRRVDGGVMVKGTVGGDSDPMLVALRL